MANRSLLISAAVLSIVVPVGLFGILFPSSSETSSATSKTEGWWQIQKGIFGRWCTIADPCPSVPGFYKNSWQAMIWCKDADCGDINARVNILRDGVIVGWTNESAYANKGDKVVLTFNSEVPGAARMVKFSASGGGKHTASPVLPFISRSQN